MQIRITLPSSINTRFKFCFNDYAEEKQITHTSRYNMNPTISWETDIEKALKGAKSKDLPILLFFHNPD